MNRVVKGGGVALGALALLVMSGISAAAETEEAGVAEAVQAIDAIVGDLRTDAVEVTDVDATVSAGGSEVTFSEEAADGIALSGEDGADIEIGLPFAQAAAEGELVDGSLVYDNNNGSTTTPLVHDDGSVQILTTIADATAPTEYAYSVDVGPGGALVQTADGGVDIVGGDGWVVQHIDAPWAYDASGLPVATSFRVAGTTLIQDVRHGQGLAYPVVADPKFTSTWWNKTLYFNKTESAVVAAGTASASWIAGYFGLPGKIISGVLAGYASTFAIYTAAGKCGKLVSYVGYPAPVPQPYWGNEAGGYCK